MTPDKATPSPDTPESRTDAMPDAASEAQASMHDTDGAAGATAAPASPRTRPSIPPGGSAPKGETPKDSAPPAPGRGEKIFQTLCHLGPLALLVILAAQACPGFWQAGRGGDLYCPAEVQSIQIFLHAVRDGLWLAPGGLTEGLAAQWPGFTWFLAALAALPVPSLLFPLAGALSAALALLGVWGLSRAAGFGSPAALAAGLILLCAPLFAPLSHFVGPAALAAALTLFSLICLCRGWQAPRAWLWLPGGFVLAGLAGLTGGLFHLLLPLLTSAAFLLWRCSFRRAQGPDALTGFALLLLLLAIWLGGVIFLTTAEGYMQKLYAASAQWPWPPAARWWLPLATAALGLVPWLAVVGCVAWTRVLRTAWGDLKASRAERSGAAFVWISLISGCLLSLFIPLAQTQSLAVCLICLAAPLLGKALLRLTHLGSRLFYLVAGLCLLHAGMALTAAGFGPSLDWMANFFSWSLSPERRDMILSLKALPILGVLCLLAAVTITRFIRRDHPGGALLFCTLLAVILSQPAALLLAPELSALPQARLSHLQDIQDGMTRQTQPLAPEEMATPPAAEEAAPAPDGSAPVQDEALPEAGSEAGAAPEPLPETSPAETARPEAEAEPDLLPQAPPAATPENLPEALPEVVPAS